MDKKQNLKIRILVATSLALGVAHFIVGCSPKVETSQRNEQAAKQQNVENNENGTAASDSEKQPPPQTRCPNADDVRNSISQSHHILDEEQGILSALRRADEAQRAQIDESKIKPWEKTVEVWKAKIAQLIDGCQLLKGQDGTEVFPEIPLALENLADAGEWLEKSMKAAASGHPKIGSSYARGAAAAIKQATKVLSGEVKAKRGKAILKVPSYIKAADQEMAKSNNSN